LRELLLVARTDPTFLTGRGSAGIAVLCCTIGYGDSDTSAAKLRTSEKTPHLLMSWLMRSKETITVYSEKQMKQKYTLVEMPVILKIKVGKVSRGLFIVSHLTVLCSLKSLYSLY
jgi:hypothetical protein